MKFGKKIILINSLIISVLTAVIITAAAVGCTTVLRGSIRNTLVDTVTTCAATISEAKGVVPDSFDYNVSGVYLSVYLSDGTLKNGSFPGELDLPLRKGVISSVRIGREKFEVYDYAISLEGRNDIYLRGMISTTNVALFFPVIAVAVFSGLLAVVGIILNFASVRRAIRPIDRMRREVQTITVSKDIQKRLSEITGDSELAQLANDYNEMLDSLEGMFRNQERFTSDVAHELRTPLTVILSESEYALQDTGEIKEKEESLRVIHRQSKRLKAITESLLEFTRFANRLTMKRSPTDLSTLTEEFLADYTFPENRNCEWKVEKGIVVAADATLYERILQNLADNAVKYGKENGHIWVELKKEGRTAVLTVQDDGIGMSKEAQEHAFDRFYRGESSRTDQSGLGLGLSFVREIVRLFEAAVTLRSAPNAGTCVTVTFNLLPVADALVSP